MITSQKRKMQVKGLFKKATREVSAFKEMENECKKDYKKIEGELPHWNLQERGEGWQKNIVVAWNKHNKKRKNVKK